MKVSSRIVVTMIAVAVVGFAIWAWLTLAGSPLHEGAQPWTGVDDSVVSKIAAEAGREVRAPLINTDQGDLLLFVFAIAGAAGGFVAGYFYRKLISERTKN